ncbi:MAG: SGNH/GDSL hydrolase N-terminal domain-containing protein [Candidatus Cryptobacteroides sp.]
MKHLCIIAAATAAFFLVSGQTSGAQTPKDVKYVFTEASDLTLTGKLFPDTPNPYHRIDTVKHKGFTKRENEQVRQSSGIAVSFRTNSTTISVKATYGYKQYASHVGGYASRGFDLYIKKDGRWVWAAAGCGPIDKEDGYNTVLIKNMDGIMKECLLYLPLFSEEYSVQIGVQSGATIEKGDAPFRHRVAIFGSSFTQGTSSSRPGMAYPAQFSRNTGIQLLSIGCSGNCKMQPQFADALAQAPDIEAFIFDSFSNPTITEIQERLFPFIEKIQAAHPGIPLIFQHTIYRERRNFDLATDKNESDRIKVVDELMAEAVKKYKDVYFVTTTNATSPKHDTSVDGTHPGDYGYTLWAESIQKPVLKILKKYGIR